MHSGRAADELLVGAVDDHRNSILESPTGEVCACDFVEPVRRSQPTVSHHLKVLRYAGLVLTRKQASWVWSSINDELLVEVQEVLTALLNSQTRTTTVRLGPRYAVVGVPAPTDLSCNLHLNSEAAHGLAEMTPRLRQPPQQ